MLRVGLTGGMGCGKSTIAHIFSSLGVPVYNADTEAKRISAMPSVKAAIAAEFGAEAAADKKVLADIVFNNPEALNRLNKLVHPLVMQDCEDWLNRLQTKAEPPAYAVVEAAILFESGMSRLFDFVITVETSPQEQIERVTRRDGCTPQQVEQRLKRQWPSQRRREKAQRVIENTEANPVLQDVLRLHEELNGRHL